MKKTAQWKPQHHKTVDFISETINCKQAPNWCKLKDLQ